MASGSFGINRTGSTSSYIGFRVDWVSVPNTPGNYSDISVWVYVTKSSSSTARTYGTATTNVNVGGQNQAQNNLDFSVSPGGTTLLFAKGGYRIYHNNDGTQSVNISVNVGGNIIWGSGSQTVALDTIPRASSVSNVSGYIESSATIVIAPKASNTFTHSVAIWFGSDRRWLQPNGELADTEYRFNTTQLQLPINLPASWYDLFTTDRGLGTITVNTFMGNTNIGYTQSQLIGICNPALCNPSVTATVVDSNATTLALTGNENDFIKYRSTALITPTISPITSGNDTKTTLKTKSVDGEVFTTDTVSVAFASKNYFTLEVINSRGMSTKITVSATGELIDYLPLTLSATMYRPEPTTGEVVVEYSGNYFNGYFDKNKTKHNTLTLTWSYRVKGTTEWKPGGTLTPTIDTTKTITTYENSESLGTIFDYRNQYEFHINYSDSVSSIDYDIINVARGFPIFWWTEDSFNVLSGSITANGFNVAGFGDYSYDETFTGSTWVDDKKIYRKVYSGGSTIAGQHYTIPIDVDFDTIVNCYGNISGANSLIGTTFNYIPLNFYNQEANYLYCEKGKIEYHAGWDCDEAIIILEYTKKDTENKEVTTNESN